MATRQQTTSSPKEDAAAHMAIHIAARTVVGVVALLVLLSLLSHDPEDTQVLAHGLRPHTPLKNWIGLFGAWTSARLLEWVGLASYFGTALVLLCVAARLTSREVRSPNAIYISSLVAFTWGLSMFIGIFPDFVPALTGKLNLLGTPGGAIGQRFCAPWTVGGAGGWLAYVVNPIGSGIISMSLVIVGLITVWYFDWHERSLVWWERFRAPEPEEPKEALSEAEKKKEERLKDRERRRQELEKQEAERAAAEAAAEVEAAAAAAAEAEAEAEKAAESSELIAPEPEPTATKTSTPSKPKAKPSKKNKPFKLPTLALLNETAESTGVNSKEVTVKKDLLQDTLDSFGLDALVGESTSGPRVTLFEIKPAPGVRVEKISSLQNNFAMALKAESLRILTPIPGKDSVGIEVPNSKSSAVPIHGLFNSSAWKRTKAEIPIALGRNIRGQPAIMDLARAPHLLIAGATGSGKSVCMNTLILSLLYRFTPEQLKLIMVDPKVVEFSGYNTLPHLVAPVITDVKKVPIALRWALAQMEWRYQVLAKVGVRNLAAFNSRPKDPEPVFDDDGNEVPRKLPFLIIIIDELADIMMTAKADVETSLARIAQLARAVGIHAVVATQRPSVNVITGVIKANFPTRIAFQVSSVVDSRTIIDGKGAEALLGRGDMLFRPPGTGRLERTQGAMVNDDEIDRVVSFVSEQAQPEFVEDIFSPAKDKALDGDGGMADGGNDAGPGFVEVPAGDMEGGDEALIQQAIQVIRKDRRATISHVQRRLRIGYNRAALVIEALEERGLIGPQVGTAPRQILMDIEEEG